MTSATPAQNAWVQKVLGIDLGVPPATAEQTAAPIQRTVGIVALQRSRLAWESLRATLATEMGTLEKDLLAGIKAHNEDPESEDEFDEAEITSGVHDLRAHLGKLDSRLIDKLDQALNAEGEARAGFQAEAVGIVKEYQIFVDGDPVIADIDANGFASTGIRATAQKTLADLAQRL